MARVKYTCEFPFRAKAELIYNYCSSASGLTDWFADDVRINGKTFTFEWDGADEKAELVSKKLNKMAKYKWIEREEEEYLIFEMVKDELTNDVSLMITDYEEEEEVEDAKAVWNVSVDQLKSIIGG